MRFEVTPALSHPSDRAATAVLQLFDLAGHDDAIMVPTEIGHKTDGFERILPEDERPCLHPLESTEDLQHKLAIIGDMHRLRVDSNVAELFDDLPALVSTTTTALLPGLGCKIETKHFEPSTEKATWNGDGYSPFQSGSLTLRTRFHWRGSALETSKTAISLARRLFMIVKSVPLGLKPHSWTGLATPRA